MSKPWVRKAVSVIVSKRFLLVLLLLLALGLWSWFYRQAQRQAWWAKVYILLVSFLFFFWVLRGAHEEGHALAAYALGIEGKVTFRWAVAWFDYPQGVIITPFQNVVVSLAGGMAVAIGYTFFWSAARLAVRYCREMWPLPFAFSPLAAGAMNFFYAFSEVPNWTGPGSALGFLFGLLFSLVLYGRRLQKWLEI